MIMCSIRVLERLRARLLAGVGDDVVQRGDALVLRLDQGVHGVSRVGVPAHGGHLDGRVAAQGGDLLHQQAQVGELGLRERPQL